MGMAQGLADAWKRVAAFVRRDEQWEVGDGVILVAIGGVSPVRRRYVSVYVFGLRRHTMALRIDVC